MDTLTDLRQIVPLLSHRKGSFHLLEKGAPVRRTYQQLHGDVQAACASLEQWGVTAGHRVGIFAPNSYNWIVHDLAVLTLGGILVPFTEDFRGKLHDDVLERYGVSLLLISHSEAKAFSPRPAHVAVIDGPNAAVSPRRVGAFADHDDSDTLTRVFSSGSAGGLKGLVISNKGVVATLPPLLEALDLAHRDRLLLFLPLSNFQQRYLIYGALLRDFDIILTDYTKLFIAMEKLNPTVLLAPPILYEMFYDDFFKRSPWARFFLQVAAALVSAIPGPAVRQAIARRLFAAFHGQFGGSIRLLITGMAPLGRNVIALFDRMQLPIAEGYGMVEAGVMAYRPPRSRTPASVGVPLRDVTFAFRDDGEIIVHRPHFVTARYFQCAPGENEQTFLTPKGIATGDVGYLRDGHLFLEGRKKEVIITAGGTKIHPEVVEEEINKCPDVAKSVIFPTGSGSELGCVILLRNPGHIAAQQDAARFLAHLRRVRRELPPFKLHFAGQPFTQENGMLRPNLKIDRKAIKAAYTPDRAAPTA